MGDRDTAIKKLEEARKAWRANPEPTLEIGKICQLLGALWERKGDLNLSVEYYTLAAQNWELCAPEDSTAQAHIWHQAGAIRQNQQRYADALEAFRKALSFSRNTDDEFLVQALEDSVENMEELVAVDKPTASKKKKKKAYSDFWGSVH